MESPTASTTILLTSELNAMREVVTQARQLVGRSTANAAFSSHKYAPVATGHIKKLAATLRKLERVEAGNG